MSIEGTRAVPPLRPGRVIEGISAVLLPFGADGRPLWDAYQQLLARTWAAGLTPAVNMDTGYVHLIAAADRERALRAAGEAGAGRPFVAGAFIEDDPRDPAHAYAAAIESIRRHGGTPILFPCSAIAAVDEAGVLALYARIARAGGPLLGFELGRMFAPFGRVYSIDWFRRLLTIEAFTGLKHSSLDRGQEWQRLAVRDRERPDFRLYTGNDLAIDMVFYGSDYLLGLSAFAPDAFACRDRLWAAGDGRAVMINDDLQYLGQLAFRAPVPAYRHSAAQFLKLRGVLAGDDPHPSSPRRPDTDRALLDDIRHRIDAAVAEAAT